MRRGRALSSTTPIPEPLGHPRGGDASVDVDDRRAGRRHTRVGSGGPGHGSRKARRDQLMLTARRGKALLAAGVLGVLGLAAWPTGAWAQTAPAASPAPAPEASAADTGFMMVAAALV